MIEIVRLDDIESFKKNNSWAATHPASIIIFREPEQTWERIKESYRTTFKDLVIGELPLENDLIDTLSKIANRLKKIAWN